MSNDPNPAYPASRRDPGLSVSGSSKIFAEESLPARHQKPVLFNTLRKGRKPTLRQSLLTCAPDLLLINTVSKRFNHGNSMGEGDGRSRTSCAQSKDFLPREQTQA
ncbi:MAG: hypothetical protein M1834_000025 [Cirrosporium novae-zelandiae]|nr:MAG: hypothetical protein M1834_000025 [Cirrosporium novae-zelandiae]